MRLSLIACAAAALLVPHRASAQARFDLPRDTTLSDARVRIALEGAPPGAYVTVRLGLGAQRSQATFLSDRHGRVDLGQHAPVAGTYGGVDPMGLFWSARRDTAVAPPAGGPRRANPAGAFPIELVAESRGIVIATDTVWRRSVAPDVRISEIREGFTATLYEPQGTQRRPAVVTLAGSQGGRVQPNNFAGGLASRGYVVLSLAYFNDEGLPAQLRSIPLEYFETALRWLRARPNVDSARIGLHGGSKGAEAALLVASTYPALVRAVSAFLPGSVVWPGCCDSVSRLGPSFTVRGKPLPHMPPEPTLESDLTQLSRGGLVRQTPLFQYRLGDSAAAARAAIPVENMRSALLLVSATDDGLWPSTPMAERIMARLRAHNYRYPYRHLAYEGAGHFIVRPYVSIANPEGPNPATGRRSEAGGTPAATQRAREQSWAELLAFFDEHLRGITPRR